MGGGGNAIRMSLLFVSRSCWRSVSRLVLSSRVGVPFVSRGLAFSCRRWRFASRPVLSSRLVSAFRGVGRIVLVLSCCAVFVSSCSRAVSSFLVVPSLPFVFVPSVVSGGGSWGCGGEAGAWLIGSRRCGMACVSVCVAGWRVGWRFGDVVSCGAWCGVSGMGGGANGETRGGTMIAPFLSARFGRSRIVLSSVGLSVSSRPSPPWNNITRRIGAG